MKNSQIYFLIFINIILVFSCAENKNNESVDIDVPNENTYPISVQDEFGFSWPESLVVDDIIYLQTDIDLLIVSVSKLMISPSGDRYFVLDKKQSKMFGFDREGRRISTFSKLGQGPGEYREIKDTQIDFNKNQFEILDYDEIKRFNLTDFGILGSIALRGIKGNNIYCNFVNIKGVYYLFTTLPPAHRLVPSARANPHEFHLLRKDGDQHDFFIPKKYGILGMEGDPRFRQSHIPGEYNLTPILGSNEIIGMNKEGIFNKYHFPFASNGVPVPELMNFYDLEGEFLSSGYFKFVNNIMETDKYLFFNFIGSLVQYYVLFDKTLHKIISLGRS